MSNLNSSKYADIGADKAQSVSGFEKKGGGLLRFARNDEYGGFARLAVGRNDECWVPRSLGFIASVMMRFSDILPP